MVHNTFLALDLELNQDQFTGPRIIQIGAVIGKLDTGEILERLSIFINPQQELTQYIIDLTKITQDQVDAGVSLEEGYNQLVDMHKRHKAFCNPVVWGQGDCKALLTQLKEENKDFSGWKFGRREIDTKTLFVAWRLARGLPPSGGLRKAMNSLGLRFEGQAHNALVDAENTFHTFRHLVRKNYAN